MTKNILYICLAALLAYSCEQKESFIFAETDGLYFALPDSKEQPWTSAEPETLNHKLDFPFKETGRIFPVYLRRHSTDRLYPSVHCRCRKLIRSTPGISPEGGDRQRQYRNGGHCTA